MRGWDYSVELDHLSGAKRLKCHIEGKCKCTIKKIDKLVLNCDLLNKIFLYIIIEYDSYLIKRPRKNGNNHNYVIGNFVQSTDNLNVLNM